MVYTGNTSLSSSKHTDIPHRHVNWHEAASCAVQIELRDYAGLLIDQISGAVQYTSLDISITLLAFRFPRKLIKHLRDERNLVVEKSSSGIYYINKETFKTQIIVTRELPPEENLYLRCLTDNLQDASLINRLSDDYVKHKDHDVYIKYLNQLTTANLKTKGEPSMVCEGLFNLFGTSSAEIIARAKEESKQEIDELSSSNQVLSSQIDYLKKLLRQNNISFDLSSVSNGSDIPN